MTGPRGVGRTHSPLGLSKPDLLKRGVRPSSVTYARVIVALYAAVAMVASDIVGALLTQAEARDRALLAGGLDSAGWLVAIFTTIWSVNAVNSHDLALKIVVLGAVTLANFVGSWSGTKLGKRFVHASEPVATRVGKLEAENQELSLRLARLEGVA